MGDAGREFEENDFDCGPELADFLESDAEERGEEAVLGLIRLTARLAGVDLDDVEEVIDPQFHHELVHALIGFLSGVLAALREETDIGEGNLGTAFFTAVHTFGLEDADDQEDIQAGRQAALGQA
jgi:hypothetical protein